MVKSGVNSNLYSEYKFNDHIWSMPGTHNPDMLELAQRCVKVRGEYWLKLSNTGCWEVFSSIVDAKKQAYNTWINGSLSSGTNIQAALIDEFFDGFRVETTTIGKKSISTKINGLGSCPNLSGRMVIPYGPAFIEYKNRPYLNTSSIELIPAEQGAADYGKAILLLLYRSLCDGKALEGVSERSAEASALLAKVLAGEWDELGIEFKFAMNWLAAIVQNPGVNLQTNLWFIGQLQGIGKGTLLTVMKKIFGGEGVALLNQADVEVGWTDHLLGAVLVEVNEFDAANSNKSGDWWNKWIKTTTCEVEIPIRQRNVGSWPALNISNYIFTSNDESPVYLDKTDRRNMIIKTTDDFYWKEYAAGIQKQLITTDKVDLVASGWLWILNQVKVDWSLVKSAPLNQIKADIQMDSMDVGEEWIRNDVLLVRDKEQSSTVLYDRFKTWYAGAYASSMKDMPSQNKWGRLMTRLVKRGLIEKHDKRDLRGYLIPSVIAEVQVRDDLNAQAATADLARIVGEGLVDFNHDSEIDCGASIEFDKISGIERLRNALREGELRRKLEPDYGIEEGEFE